MRKAFFVVLLSVVALDVMAQTKAPAFEVASMKLSVDDDNTTISPLESPLFALHNASLTLLLTMAYDVPRQNIERQPGWADSTSYEISARAPDGAAMTEQSRSLMLQQLLAERLHLVVHRETRMVKGFALVTAKGGPKLQAAKGAAEMAYIMPDGIRGQGLPMSVFATMLRRSAGQPVVDKTGLAGTYDMDLKFAAKESPDSTLPSVFTALEEQMGLKLVAQMVPQDILVIDHVDKVPVAN